MKKSKASVIMTAMFGMMMLIMMEIWKGRDCKNGI